MTIPRDRHPDEPLHADADAPLPPLDKSAPKVSLDDGGTVRMDHQTTYQYHGLKGAEVALQRRLERVTFNVKSFWQHRVTRALLRILLVLILGALGFHIIVQVWAPNREVHGFLDALYLAAITITTVGFGDNLDLLKLSPPGDVVGEVYTIVYVIGSYFVVLWATSTVVAYLVEGSLSEILLRRKMLNTIAMLDDHYILCGVGTTGQPIIDEFRDTSHPLVVIDHDHDRLEASVSHIPREKRLSVEGDATEEEVLMMAGITRARGIICNLSNDRDNLFLTLTARAMNPKLRIVARGIEPRARQKILRAGADSVVSPSTIGAMRMASEMIRPTVVSFLDKMLRDPTRQMRVAEVVLPASSPYVGKTLRESKLFVETGLLVVALHEPGTDPNTFTYNPGGDSMLQADATLVVIGSVDQITQLETLVLGGKRTPASNNRK